MLCVAASAYGYDRKRSLAWLVREKCLESLTTTETEFLNGSPVSVHFMHQIEGMWALCWCLRVVPDLNFSQPCRSDFVSLLPDLKKEEAGAAFRKQSSLREPNEIIAKCDLAYCLHWGLVHSQQMRKKKQPIEPYIVIERRRALEWLLSEDNWEDVSLDT